MGISIKNAQDFLQYIRILKKEFEVMKNDIDIVENSSIAQHEKIVSLTDFVSTHKTTSGANNEYENMYNAITSGDTNIKQTLDDLINNLKEEENFLVSLLNQSKVTLDDRQKLKLQDNFQNIMTKWEQVRNNIGKLDNLSIDFLQGSTKIDSIVEIGKNIINEANKIQNDDVKTDFRHFIVSAIKYDLNNDKELLKSENINNLRNFYEFIFPIYAITLQKIFSKPILAIQEDQFVNYIKSNTYRTVATKNEFKKPLRNQKDVEKVLFEQFKNDFASSGFTGNNLNDFISWLHGASSGNNSGSVTIDGQIHNLTKLINIDFNNEVENLQIEIDRQLKTQSPRAVDNYLTTYLNNHFLKLEGTINQEIVNLKSKTLNTQQESKFNAISTLFARLMTKKNKILQDLRNKI
ncbi:MAG: hypothetical protein ACOC2U_04420 [bacterium]